MRIAIFGGSGGVGRHLVSQALERGHQVSAVIRSGSTLEARDGLRLVVGSVLADGVADQVVDGAELVLSALGIQRRSPNPWSKLTSPVDFSSTSGRRIVDAMHRHGVGRVVAVSAAGVGDSAARLNGAMRALIRTSSIGVAYRDLEQMEEVYAQSGLDWCCVRPVTLTNRPMTRSIREVDHFGATMAISRADLAWWMLERGAVGGDPRKPQIAHA